MRAAGKPEEESARARIIYLSQLFDPEPTFKGLDFINRLTKHGFDIEVVTGFPNYPGGKVYDGYRIYPIQREEKGGANITRLAVYPSHDRSAIRRIATYLSFMITSFFYLAFRARRADLIYVYYPSLTAGLAALAAKLFRRTPVVIDIQDMWPDSLGSSGMMRNRWVLWLTNSACNLLYRYCSHIIVLSPGFKSLLVDRGVPAEKISVVFNWAEETLASGVSSLPKGFDTNDAIRILFAGNQGAAQQLDTVIDAAALLQNQQVNCTFYLMGSGIDRDRLRARAEQMNLRNVRFLPRVPLADVQQFLLAADALLVHLRADPLFRITIPSKLQAYLYAGRAILMGVEGDAADLVRKAGAGYVFASGDAVALAQNVIEIINLGPAGRFHLGQNGRRFYMRTMRRELGIQKIVEIVDRFKRNGAGKTIPPGDLN